MVSPWSSALQRERMQKFERQQQQEEFEVEKIVDFKEERGKKLYKIRWVSSFFFLLLKRWAGGLDARERVNEESRRKKEKRSLSLSLSLSLFLSLSYFTKPRRPGSSPRTTRGSLR